METVSRCETCGRRLVVETGAGTEFEIGFCFACNDTELTRLRAIEAAAKALVEANAALNQDLNKPYRRSVSFEDNLRERNHLRFAIIAALDALSKLLAPTKGTDA